MKLSEDPVKFFEQVVGFKPAPYQRDLAEKFSNNQFTAMRWPRQSGKSWIAAALLLNYALTHYGAYVGIVAPSWRQSKLVVTRIRSFLKKLPSSVCPKPQRTILYLPTTDSYIEAFPNNPDTIRGPTLNVIYWDEANFTPRDVDLWTSILFTISTTKGKVLVSSTPWNTDSVFYRIFHSEEFSDFARSHVTWKDALEPNGPLDEKTMEAIRKQFEHDPSRFKRECEADWAEDEDVWLPQSLIVKCLGTAKTSGKDLELFDPEKGHQGRFFVGLDLAKHGDYSALCIVEEADGKLFLRFWKMWKLETAYASIIGYVKTLQDRWDSFAKVRVDQTGIGDYIVEDMKNSGIQNVEGVTFTAPRKQEMASLLKERMLNGQFFFPYFTWEKPYRSDYVTELNLEKFALRKDGTVGFSHPSGTHDDTFWATALAVYSTVEMKSLDLTAFKFG